VEAFSDSFSDYCEALQMSKTDYIIERIRAGTRVRFQQDYYGRDYVVVQGRWLPWMRKRFELSFEEKVALRAALATRDGRERKAG
jgi:hypothetical protein